MTSFVPKPDGVAIVYCEGAFDTANGKTAHGLVRFTKRYQVAAVVDSNAAGADASERLGGEPRGIPIVKDLDHAFEAARAEGQSPSHFVVGLAPDGGKLPASARAVVKDALERGLNVDSGLHDYLGDDTELAALVQEKDLVIRDVRKPLPTSQLHFFSGKVDEVESTRFAVLGIDSAVGKRTTALVLANHLTGRGTNTELLGTGQTSWMQGLAHGIILDSIVNDFVSGEIEHAVWSAWKAGQPDIILIEGQGSLLNPAYPGGFEILAAGRPDGVILQHAPARTAYDGFPAYPMHDLDTQIAAVELISGKPVVAITIHHEGIPVDQVEDVCTRIERKTGLPTADVLLEGPARIADALTSFQASDA